MNVEKALMQAVGPLYPCAPNIYKGEAIEYVVWNCYTTPDVYAEELPAVARYPVQVHYYLPNGKNPSQGKLALMRALYNAGFTWPRLTNASDEEGQHYVLECEFVNAGGVYGEL